MNWNVSVRILLSSILTALMLLLVYESANNDMVILFIPLLATVGE
jgi:hypothetical protein